MNRKTEHRQDQFHDYLSNLQHLREVSENPNDSTEDTRKFVNLVLTQIRTQLFSHLSCTPQRKPLSGVGLFHCRKPRALRNVPIHQPIAVLVVSGRKIIALGERNIEILPGELLLLPGGCTAEMGNHPGYRGEPYPGLAMVFPQASIDQFRRSYSAEIPDNTRPQWSAAAPGVMVAAMAQWLEWCMHHPVDPILASGPLGKFGNSQPHHKRHWQGMRA
jgi:hypothetical protein